MADAEEYDETPSFIDMASAVEVAVPDGGEPMDDDDKEMTATTEEEPMMAGDDMQDEVPDVSKTTMTSHTDAVYAICADYDSESKVLSIVSGAGDDRAYLHFVAANTTNGADEPSVKSIPLSHTHTDSISAVSINNSFVNSDVGGKPQRKLVAVGSYDGAIVLYDAGDGSLVKVLEGPSDVEWCCFHPKGGTVSYSLLLLV
jgi:WD40 repeat protein